MKTLEERLNSRETEYESLIRAEHSVERVLEKIFPLFPENTNCTGNTYRDYSYLYITVDSVEEFEENIISELSEVLKVTWERSVDETDIAHRADFLVDKDYRIYLTVTSKPVGSCRIIAVPTGKTTRVSKIVWVDEAEVEYMVDCDDPVEENSNA